VHALSSTRDVEVSKEELEKMFGPDWALYLHGALDKEIDGNTVQSLIMHTIGACQRYLPQVAPQALSSLI